MPAEPPVKRTFVFIDGQNLFHAAKAAFGHTYPNYDPHLLASEICRKHGWTLVETRFYTGVPHPSDDPFWNHFWVAKLGTLGHRGVSTFSRYLRYRRKTVTLPSGETHTVRVGEEKRVSMAAQPGICSCG